MSISINQSLLFLKINYHFYTANLFNCTMKAATLLYSKSFLVTTISFGVLMIIFDYATGSDIELFSFLLTIVLFGLTMSLVFVSLQISELKRLGVEELTAESLSVEQHRSFTSSLTKQKAVERINIDPAFSKMKIRKTASGLRIKTPITLKSFGEVINIEFNQPLANDPLKISISSRPKIKTTMVDLGKNMENVNSLYQLLK